MSENAVNAGELDGEDSSSLEYLQRYGFSERMIGDFFRQFYAGIFLDRLPSASSRVLRFTFKMLATGKTTVPARGIGEITRQLAARLPLDATRTDSSVEKLLWERERVVGVEVAGEEHEADLEPQAVYHVSYAQFAQSPGTYEKLPENFTDTPELVLAGEYTENSSINGAMLSGEKAAEEVMRA